PAQHQYAPPPQQHAAPSAAPGSAAPGSAALGSTWHRQHFTVGVFLVVYGLTNLATGLLGFSNHKRELAGYLGDGMAGQALIGLKAVEGLLLVLTVAAIVRRKDVWFLPSLLGWVLGFAVFAVLDVVKGRFVPLAEHGLYTLLFFALLVISYGLSAKVRAARTPAPPASAAPSPGAPPHPQGLSRTQEIALNALNRWQRQQGNP
ncbi:hypothetical protein, partial [Actinocorallia lasiicapitis]